MHCRKSHTLIACATAVFAICSLARSDDAKPPISKEDGGGKSHVYRPPVVGAPQVRVGAASRAPGDPLPVLQVIAPDHAGYTVSEQPTLYWYLSSPTKLPIEFSITENGKLNPPLFEMMVQGSSTKGILPLDLGRYGVSLSMGKGYKWKVAIISDPADRTKDSIAAGEVQRIDNPPALAERLNNAKPADRVRIYGEFGLWYDALHESCKQIRDNPDDTGARQLRSELLGEVSLPGPATFQDRVTQTVAPILQSQPPARRIVFTPKVSGAPNIVKTAGSRTGSGHVPTLCMLMPAKGEALTTQAQPTFFWSLSEPADVRFQLSMTKVGAIDPVFEATIIGSRKAGIQKIDLNDYGVSLETGITYKWVMALIVDPEKPASNMEVAIRVRRIDISAEVMSQLAKAKPSERLFIYAENGIWCDALAEAQSQVNANPGNIGWQSLLDELLDQAGANEVKGPLQNK